MKAWPGARHGWTLTILLTLAYILSYVDRSIIGLMIEPIKADLGLNDEQMGYLIGPAFALFYATIGLPLGWLADRRSRTRLVAIGIALWSLATAFSGMARGFGHLFVARMGVGVGEAVLSPCAMSLISDSFPPEKRGKPVGVYSTALSLGAGIASLIGAGVLAWAQTSSDVELPILGAIRPWQMVFLAVGIPGLLLSLPFLFLREPERRQVRGQAASGSGFGEMLRYVLHRWQAFGGLIVLVAAMTITAYSQGFMASGFVRHFGWQIQDYALVNGLINLAFGPVAVATTGVLCDRWRAAGRQDAPFRMLVIGLAVMAFSGSGSMLMPSATLAFVMLGITTVAMGVETTTGIISLLDIAPSNMRGQIVSLYYMAISIAGLGIGPTSVGIFSSRIFGEENLHLALAAVPITFALIPLLFSSAIGRHYRHERQAIAQLELSSAKPD